METSPSTLEDHCWSHSKPASKRCCHGAKMPLCAANDMQSQSHTHHKICVWILLPLPYGAHDDVVLQQHRELALLLRLVKASRLCRWATGVGLWRMPLPGCMRRLTWGTAGFIGHRGSQQAKPLLDDRIVSESSCVLHHTSMLLVTCECAKVGPPDKFQILRILGDVWLT